MKKMKYHHTIFIGLAFLFTGTAAVAQDDTQVKINTILETLVAQKEVIQNNLEKISALERKNTELEEKLAAAQTTANTAVSKADAAQTTANNAVSNASAAQTRANVGVSKADAAQATANTANGKYCYITGSGFGLQWYSCSYGGSYKGGVAIQKPIAGIRQQEVWKDSTYLWLCCL